jgi:NAD(P)-dependent dehydrogenase (short-subunit alcohol dehydrogenase family)
VVVAPPPATSTGLRRLALLGAGMAVFAALVYSYVYSCPNVAGLRGKVVLITGSSSGIGEELAYQYGALGANLVLAARRASELEKVASTARTLGAMDVLVVPTDMSSAAAVEAMVSSAIGKFGGIDILLLNHAAFDDQLFLDHKDAKSLDDTMSFQFQVNVMGSAYATRAALPSLEKRAGHIAVVSSGSAKIAAPFHAGYVTTKKALHGFYDTLRHELHLVNRCGGMGGRNGVGAVGG